MNERPEIPEDITPAGYFDRFLKDRVNNSTVPKTSNLNTIIQFEITDIENGVWNVVIENGLVKEVTKELQEDTTCVFILGSATFLSILRRKMTLQQAFFKGKMEIKGDVLSALKLNVLVNYL